MELFILCIEMTAIEPFSSFFTFTTGKKKKKQDKMLVHPEERRNDETW